MMPAAPLKPKSPAMRAMTKAMMAIIKKVLKIFPLRILL
jgi:hypothetical protein